MATFDESMIAYQPGDEAKKIAEAEQEPIPVVYIPRKPTPNGLLCYQLIAYITHPAKQDSKIPYILDMCPHLKFGDYSPRTAVQYFLKRYVYWLLSLI